MIRAALISPDSDIRYQAEQLIEPLGEIQLARRLERYPSTHEVPAFLRANGIQLIFLSVENIQHATTFIEAVAEHSLDIGFVAIGRNCNFDQLRALARMGVRDFLTLPTTPDDVTQSLARLLAGIERQSAPKKETPVFTFLPAKPGVGASLTALQVSHALASDEGSNVLLADFDLNNGVIGVLLGLQNRRTIADAAAMATEMDETTWPKLVSPMGRLDVLPAGYTDRSTRIEVSFFENLIEYAKRVYSSVCLDLSGNLELYSIEAMRASSQIVLVTGADIAGIHLARHKIKLLKRLDLDGKIRVVLNEESNPYDVPVRELEKVFGLKVSMILPSDRSAVRDAIRTAKFLPQSSALGRKYRELALILTGRAEPTPPPKPLLDYLKVGGPTVTA